MVKIRKKIIRLASLTKLAIGKITVKKSDDEYLKWLTAVNPGLMHPGNFYLFENVIRNLNTDFSLLEIGSFCGLSTNAILYFLRKYKRKNILFTCDPWVLPHSAGKKIIKGTEIDVDSYLNFSLDSYKRNTSFFSKKNLPYTIKVNSNLFFDYWGTEKVVVDIFDRKINLGGPVSFCFIDGDHSYLQSKKDFLNINNYLINGGFLMFDDSADGTETGVAALMKEIMKSKKYKLVLKNPNYLYQKIL